MNIRELVERLIADAAVYAVINNPAQQFGSEDQLLMGATLLPERPVQENAFVEEGIRFRSIIANDGTRYSPVQIKRGIARGVMQVILGNSDIGDEFTGQDYDALLRIIRAATPGANISMEQMARLIDWIDRSLSFPLRMKNEKQRWEAIVNAQVLRAGDGGYRETVQYPNPSGHRVNAGGDWTDDTYNPYDDLLAMASFLRGKGFIINRQIAGTPVLNAFSNNAKVAARVGVLTLNSGVLAGLPGQVDQEALNRMFARDRLPPVEVYDGQYRTQTGSGYYLDRNSWVMVCTTGRDESVLAIDNRTVLTTLRNVLGYTAIGRPAGQTGPGRALNLEPRSNKPPRIEGEAWQTSLPVLQEPEAIGVIRNITTE